MKRYAPGVTLVELITVVAIIAILIGLLVPAVNVARRFAKETQQRAQLTAVDVALMAFRNDFGDYPPSNYSCGPGVTPDLYRPAYCGAQKLAEALVGRDMRGFHPGAYPYLATTDGGKNRANDVYYPDSPTSDNLQARKEFYLDTSMAKAFRVGATLDRPGLYSFVDNLAPESFVLCDVYARKVVLVRDGTTTREVKLGSPILYYRADTTQKSSQDIYNYDDNYGFIRTKEYNDHQDSGLKPGNWGDGVAESVGRSSFYSYIRDPRVALPTGVTNPGLGLPYRPDSYILVSAGADGVYGNSDDVCNFSR